MTRISFVRVASDALVSNFLTSYTNWFIATWYREYMKAHIYKHPVLDRTHEAQKTRNVLPSAEAPTNLVGGKWSDCRSLNWCEDVSCLLVYIYMITLYLQMLKKLTIKGDIFFLFLMPQCLCKRRTDYTPSVNSSYTLQYYFFSLPYIHLISCFFWARTEALQI